MLRRGGGVFCALLSECLVKLLDLDLVLLDDLLAEVTPLGQLLLHLLMVSQVPLESLDDTCHLVVFVHQVLGLLGLVLKFTGELRVLDDRELGGADKLVLVQVEHVYFNSSNL